MTDAQKTAIVIGGGISGLASAALLAREGYAVTLLEKNAALGGRAGVWERDGFRFDTGPSWYLMPEVFDHFFKLFGTSAADELDLVKLDPGYRVYFEGEEQHIDLAASREANLELFESLEPGSGVRMAGYLDSARETYELAKDHFLYTTFEKYTPLLVAPVVKRLPRLVRLLSEPLATFAGRTVKDPRLVQVLGYPAVFLGSSPYAAPSMYHLMSHLDLDDGVLYPKGGLSTVIDAVERVARAEGVTIVTGAEVTRIVMAADASVVVAPEPEDPYDYETTAFDTNVIDRDELRRVLAGEASTAVAPEPEGDPSTRPHVGGVHYSDEAGRAHSLDADVVVSTADLWHTETRMLLPELQSYPESYWEKRTAGPSALLVLLGVEGELPELEHHTLFFTKDWKGDFGKIFSDHPSVPDPASLYVCRPSATDDTVAPEGTENLFVLVPIPADPSIGHGGVDGAGDATVERLADTAIAQIAQWAGIPDLAARVKVRRTVGPADFADDLNSWKGTALGPAHTLRQSAMFRAKNVSSKVEGLYYAGGSTTPGIGLPMCLISAELVLKRLRGDTSTTALPEPLASAG
ncbi:phytoene desaturase family protein [Herbiconiux sp. KACC 21604]|uniref:phytoene desaturase family protein n=1 Tax=unclassified Herbiconiux TaxID=2618217 RepID=UPI001490E08B|nr:phytoene desaturase family protein [Herbiconiux sp. SALV-R1]QJU55411.1 phytoene desaturase [Herbiconiux sp. SALV-R1]WPO86586.1 phytoene desaturase family protein [Herbiconiux sp. KACC 21604]